MFFSERFNVSAIQMRALGAFNPTVEADNKLFVDPKLIDYAGEEFEGSAAVLKTYFGSVITVLRISKRKHDSAWDAAWKRMQFKEASNTALGFSKVGTAGNGIGKVLAERIIDRATDILPHVDFDPDVFELIGVFADGLGCDRLSDMLVSILMERFLMYTHRITQALHVQKTDQVLYRGRYYTCPRFSNAEKAHVLLPKEILRPLPIAMDIEQALSGADLNDEVRSELNILYSAAFRQGRTVGKAELRAFIRAHPGTYRQIIHGYRKSVSEPYDFDRDPDKVSDFEAVAKEIVGERKMAIVGLSEQQRVDSSVAETIAHLRQGFEENRLSDCIFDDAGKPRRELVSQRLLYSVSAIFARLFNVNITREPNAGPGPVDFHFSVGNEHRALLELKLSTHERLVDAYLEQLPAYGDAEGIKNLVLLVIRVSEDDSNLLKLKAVVRDRPDPRIRVEIIDAMKKPSASKRRSKPMDPPDRVGLKSDAEEAKDEGPPGD